MTQSLPHGSRLRDHKPRWKMPTTSSRRNGARVSVDLCKVAQDLFHLFDQVEARPSLCDPRIVQLSVARYEKYWLPLLAKHDKPARKLLPSILRSGSTLQAPLDIAWVWFCHTVVPEEYAQDFFSVAGKPPSGPAKPVTNSDKGLNYTQALWRRAYPKEPWDLDLSKPHSTAPVEGSAGAPATLGPRLTSQVAVLYHFIYQVSLPHHRSKSYLKGSLQRYLRFLQLQALHADKKLTPTPDVQLMAYAHMACHSQYLRDVGRLGLTCAALGSAVNAPRAAGGMGGAKEGAGTISIVADGSGNGVEGAQEGTGAATRKETRTSLSIQETAELWEAEFHESMTRTGGMVREHAPASPGYVVATSLVGSISNRWQIARPLMLVPCADVHASGQVLQLRVIAEQMGNDNGHDSEFVIFQEHCGPASTFADVRVFDPEGHVEAEAHMIGCEQLPYSSKPFGQRDIPAFTENKDGKIGHDGERAFIIISGGRDWGILLCRWLQHSPRDQYGRPEAGNMVEPRLFLKTPKGWLPTEMKMVTNQLSYGLTHPSRSFKLDLNLLQGSLLLNRMLPGWQSDLAPSLALCCCMGMAAMMLENGRGHKCAFFGKDNNGLYNVSGVEPLQADQVSDPSFAPPWLAAGASSGAGKSRLQLALKAITPGQSSSKKDGKARTFKEVIETDGVPKELTGPVKDPAPPVRVQEAPKQPLAAAEDKVQQPAGSSPGGSQKAASEDRANIKPTAMRREASFSDPPEAAALPASHRPLPPLNHLTRAAASLTPPASPPVTPLTPAVPHTTPKSVPATPEAPSRGPGGPRDPQLSPMGFQWEGRVTPGGNTPLGNTPHHPSAAYTPLLHTPVSTTGTLSRATHTPATGTSERGLSRIDFEGLSDDGDAEELLMLQNAQYTPKGSLIGGLTRAGTSGSFDATHLPLDAWVEGSHAGPPAGRQRGTGRPSAQPWAPSAAEVQAALAWELMEQQAAANKGANSPGNGTGLYDASESKALTAALMQSEAGLMTPEEERMLRELLAKQLLGDKHAGGGTGNAAEITPDVLASLAVHLQAAMEAESLENKMAQGSSGGGSGKGTGKRAKAAPGKH